ncbi:hypothetical protein [Dokdonella sp.]|uniref:hypothetical protein n=1 Tax=Dokdonella sp. TaxID=2291710 RepID=UPI00352801AF
MSKQIKVRKPAKAKVATNADKAEKLWLAGLGTVSVAQKMGAELAENMIGEGKAFQVRSESSHARFDRSAQEDREPREAGQGASAGNPQER